MTPSGYDGGLARPRTVGPFPEVAVSQLRGSVRAMPEFISVSASSYDPAGLATKLTEKSAEGWEVVAIVPTGGDITAFLRRGTAASAATTVGAAAVAASTSGPSPVVEPVGWGSTPAPSTGSGYPSAASPSYGGGNGGGYTASPTITPQPAASQPSVSAATAAASTSSSGTPAGWYHDPSGRYELRYWNGSEWTEHVSRAGQQYTDPPVA